ncbi:ECU01_0525 [Encephalitozoon cuniculi GB-M1]|uniref:ECU01_0525 protein n=1 Tax=Encephalitozoon cuniculi (strain GB-M1) TaxID=284813 RepID=I7KFV0_ENCCU|nr:uncharacterized protein ECU01_0525 [Encephalitozoon cuniculi GB-M1]UYI28420.1 hypothetical protein J0A71_11g23320 [Encephalitozoon cuniculi]CCI73903.1 ECU01_0525 [Encephalitozoon cuniculi GB-M1]
MGGFQSKYSDSNLFFDGIRNTYNARDYVKSREGLKVKARQKRNADEERKQFLSEEDKDISFLIRNRDLMDPSIKEVDSKNCHLGKFVN